MAETKLVSAEEARGLLDVAGDRGWKCQCEWCASLRTVVALSEERDALASRDALRRAEIAMLGANLDAVRTERDRLRDILAAERGERAPEGWTRMSKFDCEWENQRTGMWVDEIEPGKWQACRWSGQRELSVSDVVPTALEAIEAADRAAGEVRGG